VAAATLSIRYITDRFLPDKAIDLMDEAASRLRMEVDSKPEELDALDRQILQMQIEAEALKKEDDAASKDRLEKLEKELSICRSNRRDDRAMAGRARQARRRARDSRSELDHARAELDRPSGPATRQGGRAVLRRDPAAGEALAEAEAQEDDVMVEEAVRPEQIAAVVERWTGIPTSRCWKASARSCCAWKTSSASA
jgi:ATP-dependent Clp protease ATP-binding subunit ClpB